MTNSYAIPLRLTSDQFRSWFNHWSSKFQKAIVESPQEVEFLGARPDSAAEPFGDLDLDGIWGGRAFGESMEIRWRQRKGMISSITIIDCEEATLPQIPEGFNELAQPVQLEQLGVRTVMLWGDWQDPAVETALPDDGHHYWYEQQIPHMFAYPWPDRRQRLSLQVAEYQAVTEENNRNASQLGAPVYRLYRFVSLVPSQENLQESLPEEESQESVGGEE